MPEHRNQPHEHDASPEELAEYARVQEQYYQLATTGELGKLFALREELGFDIDEATLRRAYETILADDPSKWEIAHDLMDATGVKPGDDSVQLAYERVINDPTLDLLVRLRDETGIQPRLTPEDTAWAFVNCVEKTGITSLRRFDELRAFFGEDPSAGTIQRIANLLLDEAWPHVLEQFMERFPGHVRLDPEAVQKSFVRVAERGWTHDIQKLEKLSGIKPSFTSADVQAGYESLLIDFSLFERDIKEFEQCTGESIARETAEKVFFKVIAGGDDLKLNRITKTTHLRPEPHTMRKGLEQLLRSGESYMIKQYPRIVAALGVEVKMGEEVQNIYRDWLDSAKTMTERRLEKIALLGEVTGVAPSPEVISDSLDAFLERERFDSLAVLYKLTPYRLSAERVEKAYGDLWHRDPPRNLVTLYRITGISIPDDVLQSAMTRFLIALSYHGFYTELVEAVQPSEDRRREALDAAVGTLIQHAARDVASVILLAGISPSVERLRQMLDEFLPRYPAYIADLADLLAKDHVPREYLDEFMQRIYGVVLNAHPGRWIDFATLQEKTSIAPRFDPEAVQSRYEHLFAETDAQYVFPIAKHLRDITEISPMLPPETLDRLADKVVRNGWVESLEHYSELFGPVPHVYPEHVKLGYRWVLADNPSRFGSFRSLVGDIPLDAETIEAAYEFVLLHRFESYQAVLDVVGVPPSRRTIQQAFEVSARAGNIKSIKQVMKATGARPDAEVAIRGVVAAVRICKSAEQVRANVAEIGVEIDARVMEQVYASLARSVELDLMLTLRDETGIEFTYNAALRGSVMAYLHNSSPREYVCTFKAFSDMWTKDDPLRHHKPWGEMFIRLASVQAPSEREQYDSWKTDLEPLLHNLVTNGTLKEQSIEDGESVYEFVKEFGMFNMPTILWWVVHLRESETVSAMRSDVRTEIERALGERLDESMTANVVIQEIKKFRQDIQRDLLEDRVPERALASDAGREIIMAIRGSTQWDYDNPVEMMQVWKETLAKTPDVARLPQGYETVALDIQKRSEDVGDEAARQKAIQEVLANEDVLEFLNRFDAAFRSAAEHRDPASWWGTAREAVLRLMEHERNTLGRLAVGEQDVKKAVGLKKRLDDLDLRLAMLKDFVFPSAEEFKQNPETTTRAVFDVFNSAFPEKMPGRDDLLRGMSAFHILKIMPSGQREQLLNALSVRELVEMLENGWKRWNPTEAQPFNDVFTQYLNEHYLHPNQEDHDRTGHLPFSKELLRALRGSWGLRGEIAKHPLTQALAKIRAIEQSGRMKSGETVAIDLVPVRGPLRILSGDIGDACYSSRHRELARGDYPGLTAFVFVTGRGTNNERLRGSVLAIETKTEDEKKVLVVRANNPKEALLAGVDAEDIVRKTLDAMIELAKRRDCDMVVVPRDGASQAATNRPSVFDYYRREFGDREKVQLTNEPATNFNGYNIWEANGGHAVVKVWER